MRAINSTRVMRLIGAIINFATVLLLTGSLAAMPPHPDLVERAAAGQQSLPYFGAHLGQMHARGICTGHNPYQPRNAQLQNGLSRSPDFTGQLNALAILVEFTDHPASVTAGYFDSLIFDSAGNTVADYYDEISYGQLDMVTVNLPSSLGWQTAPQPYAYYVNGQNGTGSYPQNTQKLVEDLVDQVDAQVDFSQYDNDNDGWVDVLVVVHSGTGAEYSGSNNDIWSHKWSISPRLRDGVYISSFTVQPELWSSPGDMTIGVYAHELGHGFGLPDLYDIDNSSSGIGRWGIMAFGSWNGHLGNSPAHPCAWSRIQMGFVSPVIISANTNGQSISDVESGGSIFRLWNSGAPGDEYFLVENRQKIGYDSYLPSAGLLIWHIDDIKSNNTEEWWPDQPATEHFLVALEQADGLYELEHKTDYGDVGDPWPGALGATTFDATTSPSSDSYTLGTSFVQVDNISPSAPSMVADFIIGFAAGGNGDDLLPTTIELDQNYPNPFNPATVISFTLSNGAHVQLDIFNILGRRVRALLDDRVGPGTTQLEWDATDDAGRPVASGVYFYRLVAGDLKKMKKMVLVR